MNRCLYSSNINTHRVIPYPLQTIRYIHKLPYLTVSKRNIVYYYQMCLFVSCLQSWTTKKDKLKPVQGDHKMNLGKLNVIVVTLFLLLNSTYTFAAKSKLQTLSAWTNQDGSTLYIDSIDSSSGLLTGTYINRAQGYGCQNISYPVTGWVYGTAITFTTIWQSTTESCNSITAWTGFYYNGKISTLWQLVINGSTSTSQVLQGADTFTQVSKKRNKSLIKK